MSASSRPGAAADVGAEQGMGPVERAVEGVTCAAATVASKVLEAVPGTAEHKLKAELEEKGDVSVDTGEPLPGGHGRAGQWALNAEGGPLLHRTRQGPSRRQSIGTRSRFPALRLRGQMC